MADATAGTETDPDREARANDRIGALAVRLDDAARNARATQQLSATEALDIEAAFRVQADVVQRRIARGAHRIGMKLGFTSRAKMVQMGIDDMIWGRLTSDMLVEDGATIGLAAYVHPRIEPEIAFVLKSPLEGAVSIPEALAAVDAVAPAMEIIDSRYENFQFSLPDVIADNSSSSGVVVGAWNRPGRDISNLGIVMEIDGRPVQIGSSAAILGDPARALVAAARLAAAAGERLEAGWIILAGGATAAEPLRPATSVRTVVQHLGSVALRVA